MTMENPPTTTRPPLLMYCLAALVGIITGLLGAGFHWSLDRVIELHGWLQHRILIPGGEISTPDWPALILLILASGLSVCLSLWLVRRFAPEAHGSGIPQVEQALEAGTPVRWQRVIPIKFFGSLLAMGPGLLLGREGPTIHMGAACGEALAGASAASRPFRPHLVGAGVAAGLAAAFNAPLAGIVLVFEEMRSGFRYNHPAVMCVLLASVCAVAVSDSWLGQGPDLVLPAVSQPAISKLPWFLLLGLLTGALAVVFNRGLLAAVAGFDKLDSAHRYLAAGCLGSVAGLLMWLLPAAAGGGELMVEQLPDASQGLAALGFILLLRLGFSVLSYGTGVAGGIFAPLLALGALLGLIYYSTLAAVLPGPIGDSTVFLIAAMAALFAGSVRAPLTGVILILELTSAYDALLAIIVTCAAAVFAADGLGGKPIYQQLGNRKT